MNFFALSALVNAATSLVIGSLIFLQNARNRTNITFFLFAISVTCWSVAYFIWQLSYFSNDALLWSKILMSGAIWIPFFYFHFITRFLGIEQKSRAFIAFGYGAAIFFSVINWTPWFIQGVEAIAGFPFWPMAGPLYLPFLTLWCLYAAYPAWVMLRKMKTARGEERNQIIYILTGTAIGYAGGVTNFFLWYGIPILPYGNITASVYIVFVALAMMRFRLFNMKVIASELLIFSLWLFLFIRMAFAESRSEQIADALLFFLTLVVGGLLIRSVDREVEARELIEKQEKLLEEANHKQENLIHFISHEVKGYLAKSEAAFAAIIEGDYGQVSPELNAMVTQALAQTRQGVETIMDILHAGDFKKGTISFAMQPFDMRVEVARAVEQLQPSAKEKQLKMRFDVDGSANYLVVGDAPQFSKHVVFNLVDNAIKYTPAKGVVEVLLSRDRGKILLAVRDSGVGITDEDKAHLFTEGGRGKDSIKVNAHSTGYGLFIAKSIVDAHHGRIWAESKGQGQGSVFFVELPAKDALAAPSIPSSVSGATPTQAA